MHFYMHLISQALSKLNTLERNNQYVFGRRGEKKLKKLMLNSIDVSKGIIYFKKVNSYYFKKVNSISWN